MRVLVHVAVLVALFGATAGIAGCSNQPEKGSLVKLDVSLSDEMPEVQKVQVVLDGVLVAELDNVPRASEGPPVHVGRYIGRVASEVTVVEKALDKKGVDIGILNATWRGAVVSGLIEPINGFENDGGTGGASGSGGAGGYGAGGGAGTGGVAGATGMGGIPGDGGAGAGGSSGAAGVDASAGASGGADAVAADGEAGAGGQGGAWDAHPGTGDDTADSGTTDCDAHPIVTHTCVDYCKALDQNPICSVLYSASPDDCLTTCNSFGWTENSSDAKKRENTIQCRMDFMLIDSCSHAGASGGGVCPPERCNAYCDALGRNCQSLKPSDCYEQCKGFTWSDDEQLVAKGKVGQCFLYWAGKAGRPGTAEDQKIACENALPSSPVCVQ